MNKKNLGSLEDIRKLLILQLMKGDKIAISEEIGAVLGMTGRAIRNIATTKKQRRK